MRATRRRWLYWAPHDGTQGMALALYNRQHTHDLRGLVIR